MAIMDGKRYSREEIARREIGVTDVSTPLKLALSLCFLFFIFSVPLTQLWLDFSIGSPAPPFVHKLDGKNENPGLIRWIQEENQHILQNMSVLETHLEEESFLRKFCLPPLQYVMSRFLGQGNGKVVVGKDAVLHYSPGVESLIGAPFLDPVQQKLRMEGNKAWEVKVQPDPLKAIISFRDQLAERGIELMLLVVPTKARVEPWTLSRRKLLSQPENRSWASFTSALAREKIALFDPFELLREYSHEHGSAYLTTDTHWLPGSMEEVARSLAETLRQRYPQLRGVGTQTFQSVAVNLAGVGDISRMLVLPDGSKLYGDQPVTVHQVLSAENEYWQPDRESEILLLGDSYVNIFSVSGLGWGNGAGFAEQLSRELGAPLDMLARNDNGAYVTRDMLAAELGRGRDRLEGKKLVIWEFAERELALGDWRAIDLALREPVESDFYLATRKEGEVVTGTVVAISPSARPGTVPYRDAVLTLHLDDMVSDSGEKRGQAIVYGWGMRDNVLTALAAVRPGERVTLKLFNWDEMEALYGGYRRTVLDDEILELELPNWGEYNEKQ